MCTVKQLKDWLEQFPEDTKVQVLQQEYAINWDIEVKYVDLNLTDYRDNWNYDKGMNVLYLGN
jgi:hypothetical protein